MDPRNTKCLELVAEYHKVNTLNFNHFLLGTNYTNINSNLFFNYLQCTDKINPHNILLPDCDDDENSENISPDCYVSNAFFLHLVKPNLQIP